MHVLHEDEIIVWILVLRHNAAFINDVTEIYAYVKYIQIYKCVKPNFAPKTIFAVIVTQSSGRFFRATRYIPVSGELGIQSVARTENL